jgi:hypothetical protein
MEVALRRRLEGVASISISQERQTAEVAFARGPHIFSPEEFRAAVGEADVEVLSFEIEACGRGGPGPSGAPGAQGVQGAQGAGAPSAPGAQGAGAPGAQGAARWFVAGPNRFLLSGEFPSGADTVCISGALDDGRGVVHVRHVE